VSLLASATERKGGAAERAASFEVLEMTAEQIRHSRMDLGIEADDRGSHGSYASKGSKGSNPDSPLPITRSLDVSLPLHTSIITEQSPSHNEKPENPAPLPSPTNTSKPSKDYRQMTPSKFDASDQVVADYYIKPLLTVRKQTDPSTPISSSGFSDHSSPSKLPLQEKEDYNHKTCPLQQAAAMLSRVIPSFGNSSVHSGTTTTSSSTSATPEIPLQSLLAREKALSSSSRLDDSTLGYNMPQIKLELTSIKDSPVMASRGYPIVNSRSTSLLVDKDGGSAEQSPTNQGSQDRTFGNFGISLPDPSGKQAAANVSYISTSSSNDDLQFNHNPLETRDISGGSISTTTISSTLT
jgi:hypothetical protein